MKGTFVIATVGSALIVGSLLYFGPMPGGIAQLTPHAVFLILLAFYTVYLARLGTVGLAQFGICAWAALMLYLLCAVLGPSPAGTFFRTICGAAYPVVLFGMAYWIERTRRIAIWRYWQVQARR